MAFKPTQKYIDWIQSSFHGFKTPLEVFRECIKPRQEQNVLENEHFSEDNLVQVPLWQSDAEDQLRRKDYFLIREVLSDVELKEESKSCISTTAKSTTQGHVTSRNFQETPDDDIPQGDKNKLTFSGNSQSHFLRFKDVVQKHPETDKIIQKFHLADADWQIDNGKILKTDQLSKNILRNMTRYDKKRIGEIFSQVAKSELDEDKQFEIIVNYFEETYNARDLASYDPDILRTLFAPLKTRQKRLVEEVEENKRVGQKTPGNKKRLIVNDRLQLLNGDPESTARFFASNPGRAIYLKSFVRIFNLYMKTLREMNLPKRAQGFSNYLRRINAPPFV